MADKKISALTSATTPLAGTEVLPIVQSGSTVKVAVSDLTAGRAVATGALTVTGTLSSTLGATIQGLTVGLGAGAVATNTAVGVSALAANTSGSYSTAIGAGAGAAQLSGQNLYVGNDAGGKLTTGDQNIGIGISCLGWNIASGNTTGSYNTTVGTQSMTKLSSGSNNTAFGYAALYSNTTASNNTAVGYQAGYTYNGTSGYNTLIGEKAGYALTGTNNAGYANVLIGAEAGILMNSTTASQNIYNTFVGPFAGNAVTSGSKNTILGGYSGFAAPISATGSNFVVLSDGDGNIVASTKTAQTFALEGAVPNSGTGITFPATQLASSNANTLDDYEEGTWTPTQGAGLTVVGTFSSDGRYTKIGRQVLVEGVVTGSTSVAILSTNSITISNLPFTNGFSRTCGVSGNEAINASATFQVVSTDLYFMQTMAATTNIRFVVTYTV